MAKRLSDEEIIERAVLSALKKSRKTGPWRIETVDITPWIVPESEVREVYIKPLAVVWITLKIGDSDPINFCYSDSLYGIFPSAETTWYDLNAMASVPEHGPAATGYIFTYPMKLDSAATFIVIWRRRFDLE